MPPELRDVVRDAFASSTRVIWIVMAALATLGFLSVGLMEELKMHEVTDERWGLDEQKLDAADGTEKV